MRSFTQWFEGVMAPGVSLVILPAVEELCLYAGGELLRLAILGRAIAARQNGSAHERDQDFPNDSPLAGFCMHQTATWTLSRMKASTVRNWF